MSLSNYQNIANGVKVPFPPSISIDEIVKIHLKNRIKSVNQTMNSFMIYRKEYNNTVAKFNLSSKIVSKFVSISWKNEPEDVKDHYRQMAKNVKKCFKENVQSHCFINSNLGTNNNHVPLETSNPTLLNANQNFPLPFNIEQNHHPIDFRNDFYAYMNMDDDEFINYLSEEMALTYGTIIQSLS